MMGDTGNYLALQVKPLDVATPLLQATKIKQSQMETQNAEIQMHRDAIGAEARGLAPLYGTPDYEPARQAATQRLGAMGILNDPRAAAGWENTSSSPIGLQSIIARTTSPQLAETARHDKALEGHSAAALEQTRAMNAAQIENMQAQRRLQEQQAGVTALAPVKIGSNMGEDVYAVRDPKTGGYQKIDPRTGQISALGPGDAQPSGNELTGEDYLKQFPAEMQAAVKNFIAGNSTPTGNPRKGWTENVKKIAQKYGADMGIDVSDQAFHEKNTYLKSLSLTAPATAGGQRQNANVTLQHLAEVVDSVKELQNKDWYISALSRGANWARGLTTEQQAKINAVSSALDKYGPELTKYLSGAPGAEAERAAPHERFGITKSPQELAAAAQADFNMIHGKLIGMEADRDTKLGPNNKVPIIYDPTRRAIERIQAGIKEMRTGKSATPSNKVQDRVSGIPSEAVALLKQNPKLSDQFDAKYGVGSAANALGATE